MHKYEGRALLVATGACAVHCRYCFTRHFPYEDENASRDGFAPALDAIRADTSIREVILSGGDPLTLGDRRLRVLFEGLRARSTTPCEALFDAGVLPYYLHVLDRVAGAAHFDLPLETARRLAAEVAARLPGYLVPRLVREEPGAAAKTVLPPASR